MLAHTKEIIFYLSTITSTHLSQENHWYCLLVVNWYIILRLLQLCHNGTTGPTAPKGAMPWVRGGTCGGITFDPYPGTSCDLKGGPGVTPPPPRKNTRPTRYTSPRWLYRWFILYRSIHGGHWVVPTYGYTLFNTACGKLYWSWRSLTGPTLAVPGATCSCPGALSMGSNLPLRCAQGGGE